MPSWYNKWACLHCDKAEVGVYCIICKNADHYNMLNDIRVENSFIRTGYMQEDLTKAVINMNPQTVTNKLSKDTEIPKSTKDVSEMVKSNLTEVQSQNRACLIKIISCLRYLARQGLLLLGHGSRF